MGEDAGLTLEHEQVTAIELDYEEWLGRGSGGAAAAPLIDLLLAEAADSKSFRVVEDAGARRLRLRYWLSRWRRPGQS